jgi:hypothetical protein
MFTRFLISLITSYGLIRAVTFFLPEQLTTLTDIVGHPIVTNFNINRLFLTYYSWLVGWPICALIFFLYLIKKSKPYRVSIPSPFEPTETSYQIALVFFTGMAISLLTRGGMLPMLAVASLFTLVVYLISRFFKRLSMRQLNLIAIPFVFSVWIMASSNTQVIDSGKVIPYPWLNWLTVLIACGIYLSFLYFKLRNGSPEELQKFELISVCMVPLSTLLFFSISLMPGNLGDGGDFFHSSETVVPAYWINQGYFPWRDLFFVHGFMEDPGKGLFSFKIFGETPWGAHAGNCVILFPLYFVLNFWLQRKFFKSNLWLIASSVFILPYLPHRLFFHWIARFLLYPLVILALIRLFKRQSLASMSPKVTELGLLPSKSSE